MKIFRWATTREGYSRTLVSNTEEDGQNAMQVVQSSDDNKLSITAFGVSGRDLKGRYDYRVEIEPRDIVALLEQLAKDALDETTEELVEVLRPARASMLQILLCIEEYESKKRAINQD